MTNITTAHHTHVVVAEGTLGFTYRAGCSCGWASRQSWESRELAQADGNGHFIFADQS